MQSSLYSNGCGASFSGRLPTRSTSSQRALSAFGGPPRQNRNALKAVCSAGENYCFIYQIGSGVSIGSLLFLNLPTGTKILSCLSKKANAWACARYIICALKYLIFVVQLALKLLKTWSKGHPAQAMGLGLEHLLFSLMAVPSDVLSTKLEDTSGSPWTTPRAWLSWRSMEWATPRQALWLACAPMEIYGRKGCVQNTFITFAACHASLRSPVT